MAALSATWASVGKEELQERHFEDATQRQLTITIVHRKETVTVGEFTVLVHSKVQEGKLVSMEAYQRCPRCHVTALAAGDPCSFCGPWFLGDFDHITETWLPFYLPGKRTLDFTTVQKRLAAWAAASGMSPLEAVLEASVLAEALEAALEQRGKHA